MVVNTKFCLWNQSCSRFSFGQVDHPLWEIKTMPCTDDRNHATNNRVLELYHILESVRTEMTAYAILKRIIQFFKENSHTNKPPEVPLQRE